MAEDRSKICAADAFLTIAADCLRIQIVPGVAALLTAGTVACWFGTADVQPWVVLGGVAIAAAAAGYFLVRRPVQKSLAVNCVSVAVGWSVTCFVCAIPMWTLAVMRPASPVAVFADPINAWYESVSAVTSCGLTVTAEESSLPPAVHLWRSVCQWFGGVGLAMFAVFLLRPIGEGGSVGRIEMSRFDDDEAGGTVGRVLRLYAGMTIACGLAFAAAGMPLWEAVNHSLIVSSTGGLTVTDDSFGSYGPGIHVIAALVMVLASVSFGSLSIVARGRLVLASKRTDIRWLLGLLILLIAAAFWIGAYEETDVGPQIFNVISAVTTCGVNDGSVSAAPAALVGLMILAMVIGGSSDSTAGGLKVTRVAWALKVVNWQLARTLGIRSKDDRPLWDRNELDADSADQRTSRTAVVGTLMLGTMAVGALILRLLYPGDTSSTAVVFQAVSATSTVGLSMELVGPGRPPAAKVVETVLMLVGRLEVVSFLLIPGVLTGRAVRFTDDAARESAADSTGGEVVTA